VFADSCAGRRRFRITRLPRFLVLHMRRFLKNQFFVEKNPTIVNFPVKNLELAACVPVPEGARGGGGHVRAWVASRLPLGMWQAAPLLCVPWCCSSCFVSPLSEHSSIWRPFWL
jgi:hypothetical protein